MPYKRQTLEIHQEHEYSCDPRVLPRASEGSGKEAPEVGFGCAGTEDDDEGEAHGL